jgi:hypothetical protein
VSTDEKGAGKALLQVSTDERGPGKSLLEVSTGEKGPGKSLLEVSTDEKRLGKSLLEMSTDEINLSRDPKWQGKSSIRASLSCPSMRLSSRIPPVREPCARRCRDDGSRSVRPVTARARKTARQSG